MHVSDSTTDSKKAAWTAPELRELDVSRETKGGPFNLGPETPFYAPS